MRDEDKTSNTRKSLTSEYSLKSYLVTSGGPSESIFYEPSLEQVSKLRAEREEASAAINALNQFIFVAGHTFKGRRLNKTEQNRLKEAAEQVGLSLEVVDTLVEQTSDPNAILKYCMASNDAFARKMKNDQQLSRLLQAGASPEIYGDFDVAASVWRIFMHKIVQQFLKDHGMNLSDVMSKQSLTARLYEEAIRNETKASTVNFTSDQKGDSTIRRDYTRERQRLMISDEEAQRARQRAEANMELPTHPSFAHIKGGAYFASDDRSIVTDDVLSLRPEMILGDDRQMNRVGADAFQNENTIEQATQARTPIFSPPAESLNTKDQRKKTEQPTMSAVKRALAVFDKTQSSNKEDSSKRRQRRKSLEALEKSKVVAARTMREAEEDFEVKTEPKDTYNKQRHSLLALNHEAENRVLGSKKVFEGGRNTVCPQAKEGRMLTPIGKLKPDATRLFESPAEGHKPDDSPGAAEVIRKPIGDGNVIQKAKVKFESLRNAPGIEIMPNIKKEKNSLHLKRQTSRVVATAEEQNESVLPKTPSRALQTHTTLSKRAFQHQPLETVLVSSGSSDTHGNFSAVTYSSSFSPEHYDLDRENDQTKSKAEHLHPVVEAAEQFSKNQPKRLGEISSTPLDPLIIGRHQTLPQQEFQSTNHQNPRLSVHGFPSGVVGGTSHDAHALQTNSDNGWVTFDNEFIPPPGDVGYEFRSRRGLTESDNDSIRQLSSSPSKVLQTRQDPNNSTQSEPKKTKKSKKSRATKTTKEDKTATLSRINVENGGVSEGPGGWTEFQDSPFKNFGAREERPTMAITQPVTSFREGSSSDRYLDDTSPHLHGATTSIDPFTQPVYTKKNSRMHLPDDVSNVVVWSADRISLSEVPAREEAPRRSEHLSHGHMQHIEYAKSQLPFRSTGQSPATVDDHDGYDMTTAVRSMSSESDFNAFNSYNEVDKRRVEAVYTMQSHGTIRPTQTDTSSSFEADGGARSSPPLYEDLAENLNPRKSIHHPMHQHVVSSEPARSRSSTDTYPVREDNKTRVFQAECPVTVQSPCKLDPNKSCTVVGVPLVESSFQPMNGRVPSRSTIKRSDDSAHLTPSTEDLWRDDTTFTSRGHQNLDHSLHSDNFMRSDQNVYQGSFIPSVALTKPNFEPSQKISQKPQEGSQYHARETSAGPYNPATSTRRASFSTDTTPRAGPTTASHMSRRLSADANQYSDVNQYDDSMIVADTRADDIEHRRNFASDPRDSYLSEPDFESNNQEPTSPTQLRSADSESTFDEEDLRREAERRGISQDLVDVVLDKTGGKIRRAPLKVGGQIQQRCSDQHCFDAPIDSDTCRPASARHLQKDIGPAGNDPQVSWGTIADNSTNVPKNPPAPDCPPQDPSPRQAQAIMAAIYGDQMLPYGDQDFNSHELSGMGVLPDGISDEELKLLNRFIEVASTNFDGKKLSPESEIRVREAAEKVGLSQKFVDQLLQQANANNAGPNYGNFPVPAVGVPTSPMFDDQSTYVTNDNMTRSTNTRRRKRSERDVSCNAWEQWDYLTNLVRGWTNCGAPGDVHPSDDEDDASSISSDGFTNELTRKLRKAQRKKRKQQTKVAKSAHHRHEV